MHKKYTKIIYFFILLFYLFFIPLTVNAKTINNPYTNDSGIIINKNLYTKQLQQYAYDKKATLYNSSLQYCVTLSDVKNSILTHIYNRDTSFTINYKGNFSTLKEDLSQVLDDIEKGDNYLSLSYSSAKWDAQGFNGNINIAFTFEYLTTKEQENYVDEKVASILKNIIKDYMNDDQKEKAIHDYIVKNVIYDESLSYYSAYDALYRGKAVCQGYALLTYKMLKQVGINNRIVVGSAAGEPHAWNLVEIRGKWYHLDCTWDDPIPDVGGINYDYYNINDTQMSLDHFWDKNNYPQCNSTYVYSSGDNAKHVTSIKIIPEILSLEVGQSYKLQATILPLDATNKNISWYSSDNKIVKIDSDGNLTALSPGSNIIITAKSEDNNLISLCNVNVAKNFNSYNKWEEKNYVPSNKVWTITFNSNLDSNSINTDNLYVLDETMQNKLHISASAVNNKVILTPIKNYEPGHFYYLVIEKTVLSTSGKQIISPIIMKFNVSS